MFFGYIITLKDPWLMIPNEPEDYMVQGAPQRSLVPLIHFGPLCAATFPYIQAEHTSSDKLIPFSVYSGPKTRKYRQKRGEGF